MRSIERIHKTRRLSNNRLVRNIVHESTSSVPAKESTLRTFENFNPFQIEKAKNLTLLRRDITVVHIDCDRRFHRVQKVVLRNATNREFLILPACIRRDKYTGRKLHDVGAVNEP
ncbi:hypothetical protein ASS64_09320 [Erythrobacter sp. AP23]|nr:hypothetical protein ASS64_09320 [Erythrobacter sp. AP23]